MTESLLDDYFSSHPRMKTTMIVECSLLLESKRESLSGIKSPGIKRPLFASHCMAPASAVGPGYRGASSDN